MPEFKYGRMGHAARCNCTECNGSFLAHNRGAKVCGCMDCTYHREIAAPAPTNTTPGGRFDMWSKGNAQIPKYEPPTSGTLDERIKRLRAKGAELFKRREAERMSTIHMCERPGCESIIKGPAMGLLDIAPNIDMERKGFELCPACTRDQWELLHTPPAPGTRQRAYETPFDPQKDAQSARDAVETATAEQLAAALFQKLMRQSAIEAPNKAPRSTYHDDDDE